MSEYSQKKKPREGKKRKARERETLCYKYIRFFFIFNADDQLQSTSRNSSTSSCSKVDDETSTKSNSFDDLNFSLERLLLSFSKNKNELNPVWAMVLD